MPRSGTTWVGKIFDSHPDTLYRHEPDSWGTLNSLPVAPDVRHAQQYRREVEDFVTRLPAARATKVAATLPLFHKNYLNPLQFQARRLAVYAAKGAARLVGREVPVPVPEPGVSPAVRLVWKSIESAARLGTLVRVLDGARAVLILRHPCGYVASTLRGEAGGKFESATRLADDLAMFELLLDTPQARRFGLTRAALEKAAPVERLAWFWLLINEKALEETREHPGCAVLRYEDLCAEPLAESRRLFDAVGLGWHRQTAEFVSQSVASDRGGYYSVFKNPLKAANKWREELALADAHKILAITRLGTVGQLYADV